MGKKSHGNPSWISTNRFKKYLDAAQGDPTLALELYAWNVDLSASLFRDFSYLEVALRNSCDRALFRRGRQIAQGADWLKSEQNARLVLPTQPRTQATVRKLVETLDDARTYSGFGGNPSLPRGKILAEVSFGFWKYLFTHEMRKELWEGCLDIEFKYVDKKKSVDAEQLHRELEKLATVRNRIAHQESIFDKSPQQDHDALLHVAGLLGQDVNTFIRKHSTVREVMAKRPKQ